MNRIKKNVERESDILKTFSSQEDFVKLKAFLTCSGLVIIVFGLLVLVGSYIYTGSQPFRGPSKIYFWIFLFTALFSLRTAIFLMIFSLPLMSNFHQQLAYLTHPKVTYFIAYPGIDAIAGLCLGQQLNYIFKFKKINLNLIKPPWEMGLLLVCLSLSTTIAITRNIWQTASHFTIFELIKNLVNFKLLNKISDYFPVSDLIIFIFGVILATSMINYFNGKNNKNELLFKPLVISLFLSACWGIIQAITSFGLNSDTLSIRREFLGYGATGFQPDIHAYASLMILGAIGLIGFFQSCREISWRYFGFLTSALCWIALFMSKSRASLGLTILIVIIYMFFYFKKLNKNFFIGSLIISFVGLYAYLKNNLWLGDLYNKYFYGRQEFYQELNSLTSWRFDLHTSAINMWSQFQLLGIGLGNFYRTSADYAFSGSKLMSRLGGENAHNYFLQLLVEVGLIGFVCFSLVVVSPLFKVKNINTLKSGFIAIGSIFLGNIYSHSMIIRENMYLLIVLISLVYSLCIADLKLSPSIQLKKYFNSTILTIMCVLTSILCFREIVIKWNESPFEFGRECYRAIVPVGKGWERNRFTIHLPDNSRGVRLKFVKNDDSVNLIELSLRLDLFDKLKNIIATNFSTTLDGDYLILEIKLAEGALFGSDGGVAVLTLLGCSVGGDYDTKPSSRISPIKLISSEII